MLTTGRTEEEFWKIINTPVEVTEKELAKINKVPSYEEIQESIKKNGMGFITYAENHKETNLALFGKDVIQITKDDLKKAKLENEKDTEALEVPTFIKED